ncbi:hypothetical protein KDN24_06355 [Bacillus sp. Bva_UNVM-123]|uniref:hypothetical protein n=1 Tax=Bacillus sp. Bva_UNVM-123 TaxID=2829798 RepID=UPI00391F7E32
MSYKIQLEGKKINEVMKVGNIIRIDHKGFSLSSVIELNDWKYEVQSSHDNGEVTIYYIKLIAKRELIEYNGKRFVTKNSYELGIENAMFDDERNRFIPFWYIYDKGTNEILDEDGGEGARNNLKRKCDIINSKFS